MYLLLLCSCLFCLSPFSTGISYWSFKSKMIFFTFISLLSFSISFFFNMVIPLCLSPNWLSLCHCTLHFWCFVWSCAWKLSNRILLNWHYIWTPYSVVAVVFKYKSIFWLPLIMAAAYFSLVAKCLCSLAVGDRVILKCFPKTNTTYALIFSSVVVVMAVFLISNVVYRLLEWGYRA